MYILLTWGPRLKGGGIYKICRRGKKEKELNLVHNIYTTEMLLTRLVFMKTDTLSKLKMMTQVDVE